MTAAKRIVFKNYNNSDYFIIAGDNDRALLRNIDSGGYVIARHLDWIHMCWGGGRCFDEFEKATKAFLETE